MRRDLPRTNAKYAAQQVLREVVRQGLVNSEIGAIDYDPLISESAIDWAARAFEEKQVPNLVQRESSGASPESIHFRAHSFDRQVHDGTIGTTLALAEWQVELARFEVPLGHVGVIKGFEQYLAQSDIAQGDLVYTQNSRWGIPGPWYSAAGGLSDIGVWNFRLRKINRRAVPHFVHYGPLFALPDLPYTDFPQETLLWWPAGSAASQNIHLLIPPGYMLRVIYVSPEQDVRLDVACKLKGYIQSNQSVEMANNLRTNY